MKYALAVLALALAPAALAAVASGPRCPVSLPQDQLNACWEKASAETQARLDQLLHELKASLTEKNWALIKESQGLWAKSRAMDCKVEASFIEGPVRTAVTHGCVEKRTRQRMHHLRYYLCPRYDLTGECDAERRYD
jgi:uncharacterized protein YecT (DUF1311 family)